MRLGAGREAWRSSRLWNAAMAFKVHPFLEYRTFVQARKVAVEWVNPIPKGISLRWASFLLFFSSFFLGTRNFSRNDIDQTFWSPRAQRGLTSGNTWRCVGKISGIYWINLIDFWQASGRSDLRDSTSKPNSDLCKQEISLKSLSFPSIAPVCRILIKKRGHIVCVWTFLSMLLLMKYYIAVWKWRSRYVLEGSFWTLLEQYKDESSL